jgi:hypothetical protein
MWGSVVLGVKQAISSNTNAAEMFETGSSAPDRGFLGGHSLTKKAASAGDRRNAALTFTQP